MLDVNCGDVGRIRRGETLSAGEISVFVSPFLSKSHIAALPPWSQCLFSRQPPLRTDGVTALLGRDCDAA